MNATAEPTTNGTASGGAVVMYSPSDAAIAQYREEFAGLAEKVNEPGGYDAVHKALMVVAKHRTGIEARRVALKADALAWGRKVDTEAKRLTALLLEIETPLRNARNAVDAENGRLKREAEEAERRRVDAEEKAKRDAEEAARKAAHAAEEARLKAEADRLAAVAAEQAKEQEKLDAERRKVEDDARRVQAEKDRLAKEEADRKAKAEADRRAAEKVRQEAEDAERRRVEQEQRAAAEAARLEALRPDAERVHRWAGEVMALHPPEVQSDEARAVVKVAVQRLTYTANELMKFGVKQG